MRARRTTGKSTDSPTAAKVRQSRDRLWAAIERAFVARAEAQWTNGYRCGRGSVGPESRAESKQEDERLYRKEYDQWKSYALAEERVQVAINAFARAHR